MQTKKLILNTYLFIILILSISSCKSLKVIESSIPQKPGWVHGIEKDFLIGQGSGHDYNEAKQAALQMIKEKIASAIAENIYVEASMAYEETRYDKAYEFIEHYTSKTRSKTGNITYIQGVSLSKADDYYWEKVKIKKEKKINYYVKYPFTADDIAEFTEMWNESEKQMNSKLEDILERADTHFSVEDIQSDLNELKYLSDFFVDHRKAEADIKANELIHKIQNIQIIPLVDSLGYFTYNLKSGDYYLSTKYSPKVESNCAIVNSLDYNDYYCNIQYDFNKCAVKDENYFTINYNYDEFKVDKTIPFDVSKAKIYIEMDNSVSIKTTDKRYFQNKRYLDCHFTIESYSELPFKIDRIELTLKQCKKKNGRRSKYKYFPTLIISNIQNTFKGKGNHSFNIPAFIKLAKSRKYSSSDGLTAEVSGKIYYSSNVSGEKKVCKFQNLDYLTNW